jgi:hypothetical protein
MLRLRLAKPTSLSTGILALKQGLTSAIRLFPTRSHAIEDLAARDDEFRSICADLMDAEDALRRHQDSAAANLDRLEAQYRELIEGLATEIKAALDAAAVIPFTRRLRWGAPN